MLSWSGSWKSCFGLGKGREGGAHDQGWRNGGAMAAVIGCCVQSISRPQTIACCARRRRRPIRQMRLSIRASCGPN